MLNNAPKQSRVNRAYYFVWKALTKSATKLLINLYKNTTTTTTTITNNTLALDTATKVYRQMNSYVKHGCLVFIDIQCRCHSVYEIELSVCCVFLSLIFHFDFSFWASFEFIFHLIKGHCDVVRRLNLLKIKLPWVNRLRTIF